MQSDEFWKKKCIHSNHHPHQHIKLFHCPRQSLCQSPTNRQTVLGFLWSRVTLAFAWSCQDSDPPSRIQRFTQSPLIPHGFHICELSSSLKLMRNGKTSSRPFAVMCRHAQRWKGASPDAPGACWAQRRDALRPPVSSRSVNKYLFGSATFSADFFTSLCLFLVISLPIMTTKHSLVFLSGWKPRCTFWRKCALHELRSGARRGAAACEVGVNSTLHSTRRL